MHLLQQPLYPLIQCTARLVKMAQTAKQDEQNAISRASVSHCPLIIEALANALLSMLDNENSLSNDLEKLNTFAKLQLFCKFGSKNNLGKGDKCGQIFTDLIKLRNGYVHPKIWKESNVTVRDNGCYITPEDQWPTLGISKNPAFWDGDDACQAFKCTLQAVDIYLMDVACVCNRRIEKVMLHQVIDDDKKSSLITSKEKPWSIELPADIPVPKFMIRLESHEAFCSSSNRSPK